MARKVNDKTIKVDVEQLRKDLIIVYSLFLYSEKEKAKILAKKLDGLWSGDFLLPEEITRAINNLTAIYYAPELDKTRAKEIYDDLIKNLKLL